MTEHSIDHHPLRDALTEEEFLQLAKDVQFCRCSWPIAMEVNDEQL